PHGGRRDPVRHPWERGGLRVNDLHTPALTEELAARLGAAAVINAAHDRNDADLNRISEAHDRVPDFLARIPDALDAVIAAHGHAPLLPVQGGTGGQPAMAPGLGCAPDGAPFVVGRHAAVSSTFAAGPLRRLVDACHARGLAATVGARYPARHRENLLQLFTP